MKPKSCCIDGASSPSLSFLLAFVRISAPRRQCSVAQREARSYVGEEERTNIMHSEREEIQVQLRCCIFFPSSGIICLRRRKLLCLDREKGKFGTAAAASVQPVQDLMFVYAQTPGRRISIDSVLAFQFHPDIGACVFSLLSTVLSIIQYMTSCSRIHGTVTCIIK